MQNLTKCAIIFRMADKIINTFQQRRQLEQAVTDLAQTTTEAALVQAVRVIAHTFPPELILNLLVKYLDTPNGQLRGGLGHLAALLPAEETLPALRNVVANRRMPPQARLTAASIAQRYLGTELPGALLSDLTDTQEIAFQSLREALDEAQRNRHVLLEYATQMAEHGEEIAWMVMGLLDRMPPRERVDLLRLIAQDGRPRVAQEALQRLERLENEPSAQRALYTLQFVLTDGLKSQAERAIRKARFAGMPYTPPPADQWRALLSPADPNGSQSIWLLYHPQRSSERGILLGYAWNELLGLTHFFGAEALDRTVLPSQQAIGTLVTVTMDNGRTTTMLEAPFDYGRWLLLRALHHNRAAAEHADALVEYKLYNDWLWQFAPPVVDDWLRTLWEDTPAAAPATLDLAQATERLFQHPVMSAWQLRNWALLPAAAKNQLPTQEMVTALLTQMAKSPDNLQLTTALTIGLRAQAGWLYVAKQAMLAEQARILAQQLPHTAVTENPVLIHLLTNALTQAREH
ncbi:MAG: hypothetical protein KF832_13350 [Caldilineaceae bacterium]|nr:hypothetical protein [Caldilineaceae bacterium]